MFMAYSDNKNSTNSSLICIQIVYVIGKKGYQLKIRVCCNKFAIVEHTLQFASLSDDVDADDDANNNARVSSSAAAQALALGKYIQ